jgi:hypothetical protein
MYSTCPPLNVVHGVRSVDFTELKTRPGRYLALFRYGDEGVSATFLNSEAVRGLRAESAAAGLDVQRRPAEGERPASS